MIALACLFVKRGQEVKREIFRKKEGGEMGGVREDSVACYRNNHEQELEMPIWHLKLTGCFEVSNCDLKRQRGVPATLRLRSGLAGTGNDQSSLRYSAVLFGTS
jgi:hypothetical protein